ncbi:NADP-dependent oxidoreductase domain-containing protein 1 isoform X1 [Haplochromis burtoni]|uniref:NADP-dependent oxidoreductase domain-containing protein 1 isoform X1 n=1 Tax=Haplochromis burtoni TaxID=8153 RepID=UPI0006C9A27E|nr:NADP-dependent oxidoreductase domain-containing protein 1 isoform X1 [Haplochromis burtoni]
MADIVADLSTLCFESGLADDEKKLLYLRARSAGLIFCGCEHAAFVCELFDSLRCAIRRRTAKIRKPVAPGEHDDLRVGILGLGHLGKQLCLALLEKTKIKPSHIKISTRRPELAVEFVHTEVECFFDNRRLAAWADVLFLCCLPSQIPKVCVDLRSHLAKHCLVYSFTSAIPVTRLAKLLGHDYILKPKYDVVSCDTVDVWLSCSHVASALADPLLIEASCPLTMKGGISLGLNWVCAVLYILLNICTSASLGSSEALLLIKSIFKEKCGDTVQLNAHSFINSSYASSLLSDEPFPWISLMDAQIRETPLLRFLSSSKSVQQCLSAAYKSQMETPAK